MKNVWETVTKINKENARYILQHPLHFLKDVRYAIKYGFQRAHRGYCSYDVFECFDYLTSVVPSVIRRLSETCCGHPHDMEYEEWKKYLVEIAEHLENGNEDQTTKTNPYSLVTEKDKYFAEESQIRDWQIEEVRKGFNMIVDRFYDLWD